MARRIPEPKKPDFTPMIDVTFLLLIFFIVTLKFATIEGAFDSALPKDRGSGPSNEQIEKVDLLVYVADPGELVTVGKASRGIKVYEGRKIRVEVGKHTFRFDPGLDRTDGTNPLPELTAFLRTFPDRESIPLGIDARKGIVYGDIVPLLDLVLPLGFSEMSFAATFENE
jgi:biopolymer transport protein ExbD